MDRLDHVKLFYEVLGCLRERIGGLATLENCNRRMNWPNQGLYFFFEQGEERVDSGRGLRVVRVGTHAVSRGARSSLWSRLATHRGNLRTGGGNHRGSVFRLLVGLSILNRDSIDCQTWARGSSASREIREREHVLECLVSEHIRSMPFLWLEASDIASPSNLRAYLERNCIALLSNYASSAEEQIDPRSARWLGNYCPKEKVRRSGLWNSAHIDGGYDPLFLKVLADLVGRM